MGCDIESRRSIIHFCCSFASSEEIPQLVGLSVEWHFGASPAFSQQTEIIINCCEKAASPSQHVPQHTPKTRYHRSLQPRSDDYSVFSNCLDTNCPGRSSRALFGLEGRAVSRTLNDVLPASSGHILQSHTKKSKKSAVWTRQSNQPLKASDMLCLLPMSWLPRQPAPLRSRVCVSIITRQYLRY